MIRGNHLVQRPVLCCIRLLYRSLIVHPAGLRLLFLREMLCKLALLPLVMGIAYELIRLAGKYDNPVTRIISAPGLWIQRITTREPDGEEIECAIEALKAVIPEDGEE